MTRFDIKVNGNTISGRQGWAYICNSMKVPVLKANIDENKKEGFAQFGKVRVIWTYRGHENAKAGTLECVDGKWSIGSSGCCLSSSFDFSDMLEEIEESNVPIIHKGEVVAIALYSKEVKFATLNLYKVGAIDINCQVVTRFIPLTDEEMQTVKAEAEAWCDR